jgi:hypothetical protein
MENKQTKTPFTILEQELGFTDATSFCLDDHQTLDSISGEKYDYLKSLKM